MSRQSISGTPWHVTSVGLKDGEKKRHRSRCIYFQKERVHCSVRNTICIGSAHCNIYREKEQQHYEEPLFKGQEKWSEKNTERSITIKKGERVIHKKYGECLILSMKNNGVKLLLDDGSEIKTNITSLISNIEKEIK